MSGAGAYWILMGGRNRRRRHGYKNEDNRNDELNLGKGQKIDDYPREIPNWVQGSIAGYLPTEKERERILEEIKNQ